MSSITGFTNGLVDYAGLFPPAALEMSTVVKNYAEYVTSPCRSMLARLIVPAARLAEFEIAAAELLPAKSGAEPWRISGLVPPVSEENSDFKFAISGIQQFNSRHQNPANGLAVVDALEIRTSSPEQVERTIQQVPDEVSAFLEIPHVEDPAESIRLIAKSGKSGIFAKIRTGGVKPELIPSSALVARFLHCCAENLVGLKATAGLHHPLRDEFRLTYEPDSASATMHGFVNVFSAICFAFGCSITPNEIEDILNSQDRSDFDFSETHLAWRKYKLSADKIARIRQLFAISFGSCSFVEPTSELEQLGFAMTAANTGR